MGENRVRTRVDAGKRGFFCWHWLLKLTLFLLIGLLCAVSIRPTISRAWANVAWSHLLPMLLEERQDKLLSLSRLETALNLDTTNRSAWRAMGFARLVKQQPTEMVAAWQLAGNMDQELLHMGQQAERVHQYERALHWYTLATQVNPQLRDAWYYQGLMHERFEQWSAAVQAYQQGIESQEQLVVELGDLYFWLARHVEQREGKPVDGLSLYEQALTQPFSDEWTEAQTHYRRGTVLDELGRSREAMDEYRWVIANRKKSYWAHVNLAQLVWELDSDIAQARKLLEQAIAMDPKREAAYKVLAKLPEL